MKNKFVKKAVFFFSLLVMPLLFTSCTGHHYEPVTLPATLIVENDITSFGDIIFVSIKPSLTPDWQELLYPYYLMPGEWLEADIYDCDRNYDIYVEYDNGWWDVALDVNLPCNYVTALTFYDY